MLYSNKWVWGQNMTQYSKYFLSLLSSFSADFHWSVFLCHFFVRCDSYRAARTAPKPTGPTWFIHPCPQVYSRGRPSVASPPRSPLVQADAPATVKCHGMRCIRFNTLIFVLRTFVVNACVAWKKWRYRKTLNLLTTRVFFPGCELYRFFW